MNLSGDSARSPVGRRGLRPSSERPRWAKTVKVLGEYQCTHADALVAERVIVQPDGNVRITSMGESQSLDDVLKGWSSDESVFDEEPDEISDVFAWGLCLYDVGSWFESLTEFDDQITLLALEPHQEGKTAFCVEIAGERLVVLESILDESRAWDREILRRVVIDALSVKRAKNRK